MLTVSFFSYKGGSGRTSLLYNTIPFLAEVLHASPEHPIVVVDCDTDSAGLTFLLDCYQVKQPVTVQKICNDGVDYAEVKSEGGIRQHPFFKALPQVGDKFGIDADGMAGTVLFIPADKGTEKLKTGSSENRLKELKQVCRDNNVAALVFDTPAGDQKAAIWSVEASPTIVTVLRITNQFRAGTRRYFSEHLGDWENKRVILCPNAVPMKDITIDGETIELNAFKHDKILTFFRDVFNNSSNYLDTSMLDDGFGVNEVERFKYKECVLYSVKKLNDTDEALAYERYKLLAHVIGED